MDQKILQEVYEKSEGGIPGIGNSRSASRKSETKDFTRTKGNLVTQEKVRSKRINKKRGHHALKGI